jgi:hypothetical protein
VTTNDWHVDDDLWARYAAGSLDQVADAAIEAHVAACGHCRDGARAAVPAEDLAAAWPAIAAGLSPRERASTRWLRRVRVPDPDAVVLGASDGLHLPWIVAVAGALVCAVVSGSLPRYQETAFLMLAPLVPVFAVVAAYDATDPLRELVTSTPYSKLRLALLRTTAALTVAVPVTMAVGLLVPGLHDLAFAWLLPGLGLTTAALVLLTWLDAWSAGLGVAMGWVTVVVLVGRDEGAATLTGPAAQVSFAALGVAMVAALVLRTSTLTSAGGRS